MGEADLHERGGGMGEREVPEAAATLNGSKFIFGSSAYNTTGWC